MKKIFFIILIVSTYIDTYSQNMIYVGSKEYKSAPTWVFGNISLDFGRSSSSTGILMITTSEDQIIQQYFGNVLYIYLQNGKQVILNKIANDRLNGNISAVYSVNSSSLGLLKNSVIDKVRYNIKSEFGRSNNYIETNEIVEFKVMEVPVLEGKNMSEIDKMKNNVQERYIGNSSSFDPLDRYSGFTYYYRNETFRIPKGSINTSRDISDLY